MDAIILQKFQIFALKTDWHASAESLFAESAVETIMFQFHAIKLKSGLTKIGILLLLWLITQENVQIVKCQMKEIKIINFCIVLIAVINFAGSA
jgi:hypothetical protein